MQRIPVLIVGGGPVGLALAGELGWRGVACLLVEQTDGSIAEQEESPLVWSARWSLTTRILAVNILAVALLAGGFYYLDTYRSR